MTSTSGTRSLSRARQTPVKLVVAVSTNAADAVSRKRSRMETYETQPPATSTPPTLVDDLAVEQRVEGADERGRRARRRAAGGRGSRAARRPRRRARRGRRRTAAGRAPRSLPNETTQTTKTAVASTLARGSTRWTAESGAPAGRAGRGSRGLWRRTTPRRPGSGELAGRRGDELAVLDALGADQAVGDVLEVSRAAPRSTTTSRQWCASRCTCSVETISSWWLCWCSVSFSARSLAWWS